MSSPTNPIVNPLKQIYLDKLASFKDVHKGKRVYIIGNGPSLKASDLEKLHQNNCYSIASNKIYKIFPHTVWRPSFYVVEDLGICKAAHEDIKKIFDCPIFAGDYLEEWLKDAKNPILFKQLPRVAPPQLPNFSENLLNGINCGGTVTYSMIQIAAWMGFSEIIFLGVDFSYQLPELRDLEEFPGYKSYKADESLNAVNYFVPDYFSETELIFAPDLESSECAYKSARAYSERTNKIKILNGTRGGKLEVFDRVSFDSYFEN